MATRGSALSRVVKYFREEDLDVAVITLQHIRNIVDGRSKQESRPSVAKVKRGRPKGKSSDGFKEHKSASGETIPAVEGFESESLANA